MNYLNYQVTRADESHYRIYSPAGVYMDLVVGQEKALLIDTGYGFGDVKGTVRSVTNLPLVVVNTHGHVDHACGNGQFSEPVYIHPLDIDLCREHTGRLRRRLALEYAHHCPQGDGEEIDLLPAGFDEAAYLRMGTGTLLPMKEGDVFDLGGAHMRVLEMPGHTAGSVGLLYEEKNLFFAGDAFNPAVWLFLPEALSLKQYAATLRKAVSYAFDALVFSHVPEITSPDVLGDYLDLAEHLDYESGVPFSAPLVPAATARTCFRKGYSPEDMEKKGFASIVINRDHL